MAKLAMLALVAGCYTDATRAPAAAGQPATVEQPKHVRTAADPLGFLPIDSELVAHLDVGQLRHSALWARFEPRVMAKVGPTFDQFRAACGFDVLSMVKRVALGMRDLDAPRPSFVLVVRGIERARMMTCVDKAIAGDPKIATVQRGASTGAVVTIHGTNGDSPTTFAFADAATFVLLSGPDSSVDHLRSILDSGSPLRGSDAFVDMFGRIDSRRAAWFFLGGSAKLFSTASALGFKPKAMYGSFDLASGISSKMVLKLSDPAEATNLVNLVQAQVGLASSFVERLELSAEDADVVLDVALTDEQAQNIANLISP